MNKQSAESVDRKSPVLVVNSRKASRSIYCLLNRLGMCGPNNKGFTPYSGDLPPQDIEDSQFALSYLHSEYLSKFDDAKSSSKKAKAAWERFSKSEESCRQTNEFLRNLRTSKDFYGQSSLQSTLWSAQRKIQGLLGPLSWDEASLHFGFGPGATTRLPRSRSHKVHKYSGRPETTIGNASLAHAAILQRSPPWNEGLEFREGAGYCDIVPGNRVVTVPKNYKTDRVIAIEPDMNMFIQKGLGGVIRGRLRRVGVDLNDQTRNQKLALVGSLSGLLATIDLSMASDTVSTELVRWLLPPDWFEALEQCRSFSGVLPSDDVIIYQKFSSMGNGYTFELESLIFWALSSVVIDSLGLKDRRLAVYGDDIIVPSAAARQVMDTLILCGFAANEKKTHIDGRFRESCGKHYLNGHDVSPFYVRRDVKSLRDLFLLHNNVYRWSARVRLSKDELQFVRDCLLELRALAPRKWRKPRIPDGIGDGAFIGSFDECTPRLAFRFLERGYEGYSVQVLADVSQLVEVDCVGRLTWSLDMIQGSFSWANNAEIRSTEVGVSEPPRVREVMTLVPLFPIQDHFWMLSV